MQGWHVAAPIRCCRVLRVWLGWPRLEFRWYSCQLIAKSRRALQSLECTVHSLRGTLKGPATIGEVLLLSWRSGWPGALVRLSAHQVPLAWAICCVGGMIAPRLG
jgi:hypothetical protein